MRLVFNLGGEQYDGNVARLGVVLKAAQQREAVHLGHHHVAYDEVWQRLCHRLERLAAVGVGGNMVFRAKGSAVRKLRIPSSSSTTTTLYPVVRLLLWGLSPASAAVSDTACCASVFIVRPVKKLPSTMLPLGRWRMPTGKVTVKMEPLTPSVRLRATMSPPCSFTSLYVRLRPMPKPKACPEAVREDTW